VGEVLLKPEVHRELFNTWDKSQALAGLYRRRAIGSEPEMTCAIQASEIVGMEAEPGDTILDVGCGSGWFARSLQRTGKNLRYFGIDKTELFVRIGQSESRALGIAPENIVHGEIEHAVGSFNHVVCMNVLSNIDNWHRPLDRMAEIASKTVILRESLGESSHYSLVVDKYLDSDRELKVHVNTYSISEMTEFMRTRGFTTEIVSDIRTGGKPEYVIDYLHYWTFAIFRRVR
jgi:ubiquinone/menaquinone biosynthesis C-methylase UbiE